jgi:hypothetical protein
MLYREKICGLCRLAKVVLYVMMLRYYTWQTSEVHDAKRSAYMCIVISNLQVYFARKIKIVAPKIFTAPCNQTSARCPKCAFTNYLKGRRVDEATYSVSFHWED